MVKPSLTPLEDTNLGWESWVFFTLIQGKEPPSQPSYEPAGHNTFIHVLQTHKAKSTQTNKTG